jgi:TRAP-type C4-dicarboxylate transport system permease small subunit
MTRSWLRLIHRIEEGALAALMGAMVLVSSAQIALRNLCSYTLPWAEPLVQQLLLWTALLGALVATRHQRHIHFDLFLRLAPPRLRLALQALGWAVSALVCLLLAWVAIQFVRGEAQAGTTGVFALPVWMLQLVFPLSFGAMGLRFGAQAVWALRSWRGGGR